MGHISGSPTIDGDNQPQTVTTTGIPGYVPPAGWHVELTAPTIWDGILVDGTTPMLFPTTLGAPGQVLTTDGAGNLAWAAGGGAVGNITVNSTGILSGTSGRMVYDNGGTFGETSAITTNGVSTLTVGTAANTGTVKIAGTGTATVDLKCSGLGNTTFTFPPTNGTATYILSTDGAGNTSWVAKPSGGSPAGGNKAVQYNNSGAFGGDTTNFLYDSATSELSLGAVSFGNTGKLTLYKNGATGGITLESGNVATAWTMVLPVADGTAGQFLKTDGAGNTSWATAGGGGITVGTTSITGGTSGAIPFNNANVYDEDAAQLFWDNTNNRLGITTNTPSKALDTGANDALISGLTIGKGAGSVASNTVVGSGALAANTTGAQNTAIGVNAAAANTLGNLNTCIGYNAGAVGTAVGFSGNVAIGNLALGSSSTAGYCIAIGYQALRNVTTGTNNVGIGYIAGRSVTSGANNTFVGYNAGQSVTTGSNNAILGSYSGTAAPVSATGSNWIVLSDGAGTVGAYYQTTGGVTGWIQSNNSNVWSTTSDARLKENIVDLQPALDKICSLRAVDFDYIETKQHKQGFIAQEYKEVFPQHVSEGADGYLSITPDLLPHLVKAIQELKAKNDELSLEVDALKDILRKV